MKKSVFTLSLITIIIFSTFAGNTKRPRLADYVVTKHEVIYTDNVKVRYDQSVVIKTESGEKTSFSPDEVKAYRKNGKLFKRFYKVAEGSTFVSRIFMQKLYSRAGYDIYRYGKDFYVYSGDSYELKIDKENYKVVLAFFFPKFNKMFS